MVAAALLGALLPGCPASDKYFVDLDAGVAGSGTGGGSAGAATMGGSSALGGTAGASGGSGGTEVGGTGGTAATGGTGASGGTSGTDSSGGAPDAGTAGEGGNDATAGAGGDAGCVPETERCDGIDNDCDGELDEGSVCPDTCIAKRHEGRLYVLCASTDSDDAIGADDAFQRCGEIGTELGLEVTMGLAWIDSSDENDFLKAWIAGNAPSDAVIWMGANDQRSENTWVWGRRTDAEQFFTGYDEGGGTAYMGRFNDWAPERPTGDDAQDCGAFDSELDWQWNDFDCDEPQVGFVCDEHPRF